MSEASLLPSEDYMTGHMKGKVMRTNKTIEVHSLAEDLLTAITLAAPFNVPIKEQMNEIRPPELEMPVMPIVDIATHEGRWQMQDHRRAARYYLDYIQATKILKKAFFNCLDDYDQKCIAPGGHYNNITLRDMYLIIWNKYSLVSNNDMTAMEAITHEKMDPNATIEDHITKYRTAFYNLHTIGQQITEQQKVSRFMASLLQKAPYSDFHTFYNQLHNNHFTRNFIDCTENLLIYVNNDRMYRNQTDGSANATYGIGTKSTTPVHDGMARELKELQDKVRLMERASKEKGYRADDRKMQSSSSTWCWTHGECYHNSKDCREHNRDPGHNERATATKPMGSKWGPHESKPKSFRANAGRASSTQEDTSYEAFLHEQHKKWVNAKKEY